MRGCEGAGEGGLTEAVMGLRCGGGHAGSVGCDGGRGVVGHEFDGVVSRIGVAMGGEVESLVGVWAHVHCSSVGK